MPWIEERRRSSLSSVVAARESFREKLIRDARMVPCYSATGNLVSDNR